MEWYSASKGMKCRFTLQRGCVLKTLCQVKEVRQKGHVMCDFIDPKRAEWAHPQRRRAVSCCPGAGRSEEWPLMGSGFLFGVTKRAGGQQWWWAHDLVNILKTTNRVLENGRLCPWLPSLWRTWTFISTSVGALEWTFDSLLDRGYFRISVSQDNRKEGSAGFRTASLKPVPALVCGLCDSGLGNSAIGRR